ncbi:MAG: tetratricopeptide repeat protein, partial [Planctomycetota bacterium]
QLRRLTNGESAADYLSESALSAAGYVRLQNQEYDVAVEILSLTAELFPDSWNAYDRLGEAYAAAGKIDKAVASYERSLELNPESESGKAALEKLRR